MEGLRRVASAPKRQSAPSSQRLINSLHGIIVLTRIYLRDNHARNTIPKRNPLLVSKEPRVVRKFSVGELAV
jgi:hypothetical protein